MFSVVLGKLKTVNSMISTTERGVSRIWIHFAGNILVVTVNTVFNQYFANFFNFIFLQTFYSDLDMP